MQQLLNPFAQKYPEHVEATLPSQSSCLRFNPSGPFAGHYLAVGGSDGLVEVWDVETRGVVRSLEGHVKVVNSVSWSRNNRYLLSASSDSTCIIWDLAFLSNPCTPTTPIATGESSSGRVQTIRFDAPVVAATFHPRNWRIMLVTLACNEVVLVDLRKPGGRWILKDDDDTAVDGVDRHAVFSPCGSRIYAGATNGTLLILDPVSCSVLQRIQIAHSAIRQIAFDLTGNHIILSSTDRALRVLQVLPTSGLLSPMHRFQDLVNRTPWHAIGFSGDSEYVMGGAGHKMGHNVFIWDRESGVLVKVLEGPRESLGDADWHPTRPIIASAAVSGSIHIWQTSSPDNWAAFAPGFEELEENAEYDEREDEFDIEDENETQRRQDAAQDFSLDVFTPPFDYPRRPDPAQNGEEAENFAQIARVKEWADRDLGGDTWDGLYLSLDLEQPIEDTE